ncbi:Uncharacterized protein (Fragment), partial [Durusdinium trenchii]
MSVVAGTVVTAHAQIEWDNASGGDWNLAANWNPMTVPGPGTTASVSLPGTYDIFTNASVTIDNLLLTNPNATVGIGNGRDFRLNGATSTIDGVLVVNGLGGTSGSRVVIGNMMQTLGGNGQIFMNDSSPSAAGRAQIVDAAAGFATMIGSDLLVRGSGQMNFTFINEGTIRADQNGRDLWLLNTPKTNNGRMESTDGGELRLTAQINQGPTGEIVADGGDIRFTSTIVGGSIDSSNGLFEVEGGSGNFTDIAKVTGDVEIQNGRDLVIRGGLDMDGTVFVNRDGGTSGSRFLFATSGTLEGDLTVRMNDTSPTAAGRAQFVDAVGGITTTIADTVAVRGAGQMTANFINEGTVSADSAGRELAILGVAKVNNSLIEAVDGGLLRLGTPINQGPDGRIVADGGEVRLISTIEGGRVDSTNGLFEIEAGAGNLNNLDRFDGDIEIQNGRDLVIRGGLIMNGEILVNREGGTSGTRVLMGTSGTLDGDMTITMVDTSPTAGGRAQFIDAVGGLVTTLGENVVIQGSGQLSAAIINEGTIIANAESRDLLFIGAPKTNNNLVRVDNGGSLRFAAVMNQSTDGRLEVVDGRVRLNSTIAGGTIDNSTGQFEIAGGTGLFDDVDRFTGEVEIENGRDLLIDGDLTLDGTIIVNREGSTSGTRVLPRTNGTIDGDGEIFLNDTSPTIGGRAQFVQAVGGITTTLDSGVSLTGAGQLGGVYVLRGGIAPGRAGASFGETGIIRALTSVEMADTTVVRMQIGGRDAQEFDQITGSAAITVDGTFEAEIIDGFEPDTCENFVVISGSSITGEFDTFVPPPVASNIRFRLFYTPTTVELRATCLPDIDGDCELTIFDFL